jgi:hypothetical protein
MNRFDERRPRFWRHERERDDDYRFRSDEESGRTAGDPDRQPYSGNPYGYHPGEERSRREWSGREAGRDSGRDRGWGSSDWRSSERYGQREPYNARGGSQRSRWGGPWNEERSRYSESQYGERYEPDFGERPFADRSESPGYFGTGYYGDGGTNTNTGGYDDRQRGRVLREEPRRYRTGPKGYTRSDDRIREDICERLMLADSIDSSEVSLTVKDGRVSLEGSVPTRSMKHSIEDVADHTAGVTDVDNRIRVQREATPSSSGVQTASGITPTTSATSTTGRTKQ